MMDADNHLADPMCRLRQSLEKSIVAFASFDWQELELATQEQRELVGEVRQACDMGDGGAISSSACCKSRIALAHQLNVFARALDRSHRTLAALASLSASQTGLYTASLRDKVCPAYSAR